MIAGLITSRFGLAVMAFAAAMSWHYIDKASAVRNAKEALADQVTIETLQAERDAAMKRAAIANSANANLRDMIEQERAKYSLAQIELEEYEKSTSINPECVVDPGVAGRLLNR